ncbi:hypothetical protein FHU29_001596 [Hoyosella altamirensis]|uniref:Uncharacterized protein n=1 Tax=Hoyosella altamirensis TaxID=616997 RepID=A0A839RJZ8_9ACTN|nr:hypothetical protein [Hoyosella altamirensis]
MFDFDLALEFALHLWRLYLDGGLDAVIRGGFGS